MLRKMNMGKIKLLTLLVALVMAFSQSLAWAALGSVVDDSSSDDAHGGSGIGIPSNSESGQIFQNTSPAGEGTLNSMDVCGVNDGGYTPCLSGPPPPNGDDNADKGNKDDAPADKESKGKNGDKAQEEAAAEAARQAAVCRAEFQSVINTCEGAISSTAQSCDANQNQELKSVASQVDQSGQNSTSAVNLSCVEAGEASQAARSAMSSYRQECNGSLNLCRSSCQEVTRFLQGKPQCYSALNLNSAKAQSLAQSKTSSCESFQARVSDADQSIANYGRTATASAACDVATNGGVSEASVGNSPALISNPSCQMNDPTSLVCICSTNPQDVRCNGDSGNAERMPSSSMDSSARLTTVKSDISADLPKISDKVMPPVLNSGDTQGVDGRQGGAAELEDTHLNGVARNVGSSSVPPTEESLLDVLAGFFGGGNGGDGNGFIQAILPGQRGDTRSQASAAQGDKTSPPDLRQFLPGGVANPFHSKIAGAAVGLDGITGPHSDIWKKIRNRYQVLQGTFEP